MSKGSGSNKKNMRAHGHEGSLASTADSANSSYLYSMKHAPQLQNPTPLFQMLPVVFFTALIIVFTRMVAYKRPMSQFFWSSNNDNLTDFFSYFKMIMIIACTAAVLLIILYKAMSQSLVVKRSFAYIPMIVYAVLVLLSYGFSDYKDFALWGWNDRFEGTLTLLCYMVMLFYIINTINTEKNVKWVVYTLAVVSALLGLLGLTQAIGHDFFQTTLGKRLITPTWFWNRTDSLNFTFKHNEIYQTVYNINYVSFYLTLLIPIFGMLFIRSIMLGKEESLFKKVLWGALFALLIFNLIGSESSGGLLGMGFVVLVALIVLNKKILFWWKPVLVLLAITIIIGSLSYGRWMPELSKAVEGVSSKHSEVRIEESHINHHIDYFKTKGDTVILGFSGDQVVFKTYPDDPSSLTVKNADRITISLKETNENDHVFQLQGEQYDWITVKPAADKEGNHYFIIATDGHEWPFMLTENGPKYLNGVKKAVDLREIPAIGWENNQSFGTGRGYIWSRAIPLLKGTLFLGHGADTFCAYFPQDDYVGRYNSGAFSDKINIIVDKPHNMYLGAMVGTGVISVLVLLVLWCIYVVQSFRLYWKQRYTSFLSYAGVGIFLGICGFLVSGLVNDSSVSVMPMFYGVLGTGIAVNMILKRDAA